METRIERRLFIPLKYRAEVLSLINRCKFLKPLNFKHPVTETVYFTLGKNMSYAIHNDFYVRLRRYTNEKDINIFTINNSLFHLEIKTKDNDVGVNSKNRFEIAGDSAIKILAGEKIDSNLPKLPLMYPYAATQSHRFHWIMGDEVRITLDNDVFFYGFQDNDWFMSYKIGHLGELKIELKLEKGKLKLDDLIVSMFGGMEHETKTSYYVEGRIRACHSHWMQNAEILYS